MVDELLGQQQVVIKCLGKTLSNVQGVSGGAILGDGQVGLILDAAGLVYVAHAGEKPAANRPSGPTSMKPGNTYGTHKSRRGSGL